MTDIDEKELIVKAQQGNERAFETLIRRYYDRIFAMAYSWCLNRDTAEDITQNVCFSIAKNIRSYKHNASFLTWTYRITINTAKNMATSERRRRYYEKNYAHENANELSPSSEEALAHKQSLQAVNALPESIKAAVLLVHAEGMNHKQAAEVLGCAEVTVSWRLHKARKLLAEKNI